MDSQLSTFLRGAARRPFSWGTHDCLMWLADWIAERRGADPGQGWRGSYRTRTGAHRIVKEAGGMAAHVERIVEPLGLVRTEDPQPGDIAVVDAPEGHVGAIVTGEGRVACLTLRGLLCTPARIVAAWRV